MAIQYINTGTSANSGNGDSIRSAFTKVNESLAYLNSEILNIELSKSDFQTLTVTNTATFLGPVYFNNSTLAINPTNDGILVNGLDILGNYKFSGDTFVLPSNSTFVSASTSIIAPVRAATESIDQNAQLILGNIFSSLGNSFYTLESKTLVGDIAPLSAQAAFGVLDPTIFGQIQLTGLVAQSPRSYKDLLGYFSATIREPFAFTTAEGSSTDYATGLLAMNSGTITGVMANSRGTWINGGTDGVTIANSSSSWQFRADGNLVFPDGSTQSTAGGEGGGGGPTYRLTSGTSVLSLNSLGYLTLDQNGAYDGSLIDGTLFRIDTSQPNYTQMTLQNTDGDTTATSDIMWVRDDGDVAAGTGLLDVGINSSNYVEDQPYGLHTPGSAYMFANDADLIIGTQSPGKRLIFHAGGTTSNDSALVLDGYAWQFNRDVQVVVPTPGPLNFTVWNTQYNSAAQAIYQAMNDATHYLKMGINATHPNAYYGNIAPADGFVHIDGSTATLHIGGGGDLKFWSEESTGGYENGTTATLVMSKVDRSSTFGGDLLPAEDKAYSLGSSSTQWRSLYVSTDTIYINNIPLTLDTNNNLTVNGSPVGFGSGNTSTNLVLTNSAIVYPEPFAGSPVSFTKADYGDEVDQISQYLHITRDVQYGIYNPVRESGWDDSIGYVDQGKDSPRGTMWNIDGWTDLTNLASRTYQTFYIISGNNNLGNWVPYQEWVMHDTINDKYYKFEFVQSATGWGSGGRLSYTRTQLDPVTGDPIGSPVSFTRLSGHPETVDVIDTGLTIARANNYPWYNSAQEAGYSFTDNTLYNSPLGSEWNDDGWHDLHSVAERSYGKFYDINDHQLGYEVLNKKFVMHDIVDDKYYTVQFTSWTQNGNGGGFSYVRQEINRSHYFIHTANGSEVDDISPDVGITRDSNGFVYNPYTEGGWDYQVSPEGTLWNLEGWENIDNITSRTYLPLWEAIGGYGAGEKVPHRKYILYVPSTGDYYAVDWVYWANGHDDPGGGFVYKRYSIDLTKISEGVKFADGTVQTTAYQPNVYRGEKSRVVSKAFGIWKIIETSGSAEVGVSAKTYGSASTATSWTDRNDAYITANWDTDLFNLYQDNTKRIEISLDGGTNYFEVDRSGYWNGYYMNFYRVDGHSMTTTLNQVLTYRSVSGGDAVRWFNTDVDNFRGAIIEFQAYSFYSNGSIIGTIHISEQDYNITHTEVTGGGSNLSNVDIWYRNTSAPYADQSEIWFRRLDGNHDTVRIHWTAKIFTGLGD